MQCVITHAKNQKNQNKKERAVKQVNCKTKYQTVALISARRNQKLNKNQDQHIIDDIEKKELGKKINQQKKNRLCD